MARARQTAPVFAHRNDPKRPDGVIVEMTVGA